MYDNRHDQKGHDYYYCTNGKGICQEHKQYLRGEVLDSFVADILDKFQFNEELVELVYQAAKEKLTHKNQYLNLSVETIKNQLKLTQEKQDRLLDTYLSGSLNKEIYEAKMKDLENEKITLEAQLKNVSSNQIENTLELTKKVFLIANEARKSYLNNSSEKKREIIEELLWNLALQNKKVASYQLKMPYQRMLEISKPTTFNEMLRLVDAFCNHKIEFSVNLQLLQNFFTDWQLTPSFA